MGLCVQTAISESDNVKDTPRRKAGQAGPVENARCATPVPYAQIPLCLLAIKAQPNNLYAGSRKQDSSTEFQLSRKADQPIQKEVG